MRRIRQPDIITRPDPVKKDRAIAEALREFRRAEFEPAAPLHPTHGMFGQWKGFAAGIIAALALVWLALPQVQKLPALHGENELAALQEMRALFGNKLKGILLEGGTIQPVLSSGGEAFTHSQPILITLQQDGKTMRILCYSGNMITVPVQGKDVSLNAYVDAKGNVVIEGQDFLWSQGKTLGAAPASLSASAMGTDL